MNKSSVVQKKKHESLFYITKRDSMPFWKSILIRAIAIIIALIIGSVFIVSLTGKSPFKIYSAMFEGSFGTVRTFWDLLQNMAMLLGIAVAITPAFRMKFWNIGAEGQVLAGCLSSVICMHYIGDALPSWLLIIVMLVLSMAAGAIWAGIPGYFKAKWNTNETLFTLMMNYVMIQIVSFFIAVWVPSGSGILEPQNVSSECGWLPKVFGQQYFLNVAVVLVLTVGMFIYLRYTKHGYEISVVGESENTAKYIGINVKKVIIRTVLLSGALCGIVGFLLVSGKNHMINTSMAGGNGFTAIMVSWLAKFNPFYMILTAFLISFLKIGGSALARDPLLKLNVSLGDIISAIVILFIIGSEFFITYKINYRGRKGDRANV